jgi:MFS family permease
MSTNSHNRPRISGSLKENTPLRPYYGYVIVLIGFLLTMFGWGIFYIYGVFFRPLEADFGWTRAVTSGAFSISVLMSGLSGILAGRLSDKFGPRIVIIFCALLLSMGYVLMSIVQNAWQFYLLYGILISTGVGGFWAPPVSTVARWFTRKRGIMTGIVSGGISFGALILPPFATQLINKYDWRVTYVIIGIAVLVISLIGARFLRRSPQELDIRNDVESQRSSSLLRVSRSFTLQEAMRMSRDVQNRPPGDVSKAATFGR